MADVRLHWVIYMRVERKFSVGIEIEQVSGLGGRGR